MRFYQIYCNEFTFLYQPILEDPGGEGKSYWRGNISAPKSGRERTEPIRTDPYRVSSKRLYECCLLIGLKKITSIIPPNWAVGPESDSCGLTRIRSLRKSTFVSHICLACSSKVCSRERIFGYSLSQGGKR